MADEPVSESYAFGPFVLEPTQGRLMRGDEVVALRPKVFDTLLVLVRNAGRLVEKDELMALVWPDAIVEEGNLAHNNLASGIFVWQNVREPHRIRGFTAYNNGSHGIHHGAHRDVRIALLLPAFGLCDQLRHQLVDRLRDRGLRVRFDCFTVGPALGARGADRLK